MANDDQPKDVRGARPRSKQRSALRLVHSVSDKDSFGAGTNEPPTLAASAEDYLALMLGVAPAVMDPQAMVAEVRAYAELEGLQKATPDPGVPDAAARDDDIDWLEEIGWFDGGPETAADLLALLNNPGDDTADGEVWWSWLTQRLPKAFDKFSEAEASAIDAFLAAPAGTRPGDFPLLPKAVRTIAKDIDRMKAARRGAVVARGMRYVRKPHCFWMSMNKEYLRGRPLSTPHPFMPGVAIGPQCSFGDLFAGQPELWCYFKPDDEFDDAHPERCFVFRYSAVLLDVRSDGVAQVVASASGYYLPLVYAHCACFDHGAFNDVCDAHSEFLAEVSDAVLNVFLPAEGYASLQEYAEDFDERHSGNPAILVPWVYVAPRLRKHRIMGEFLRLLASAVECGNTCNYTNPANHRSRPDEDEISFDDDDLSELDALYETPSPHESVPHLFLIPINGNPPPEEPAFDRIYRKGTPTKKDLDPAAWQERALAVARHVRQFTEPLHDLICVQPLRSTS